MSWFLSREDSFSSWRDRFDWPDEIPDGIGDLSDAIEEVTIGLLLPAVQKVRSAFNETDFDFLPDFEVEFSIDPGPAGVISLEYLVIG